MVSLHFTYLLLQILCKLSVTITTS
jgi:hypothetical protein